MFEIMEVNGRRRTIRKEAVISIGELGDSVKSNTVITLSNNETIYTTETYDHIKSLVSKVGDM